MIPSTKIHPNDHGGQQAAPQPVHLANIREPTGKLTRRAKDAGKTSPPQLDTATTHQVTVRDLLQVVAARSQPRRLRFWLKCVWCIVRILWNLASPAKAYMLSFYGLPGDDLVFTQSLNWTMEVDYQYARALYDMAGVKYTAPTSKPMRFINMYQDFVVFNRATKWARYLDDFQQDPYVGLFCRTSLVPKADKINPEMEDYCSNNGLYAGHNYLEQTKCRVNEVSEAVMCLKGIDALTLLNYEWKSALDPNDTYVQQGARLYQDMIFPDLDACLARRHYLVGKLGSDDALQQLTQELAANYSLDPTGFAGKKALYAEVRFYGGFKDLSGKPSGVRSSRMSGSLSERTQPFESDLNALVLGRERLWWLVGETPANFLAKVPDHVYYAPYIFVGMHIDNKATSGRFVDRYSITKVGTVGICQNWEMLPTSHKVYPDPIYLASLPQSSVLTAYGDLTIPRILRDKNVTDPVEIARVGSRLSTQCLSRDGCLELCKPAHAPGWVATFDRSGLCQQRDISASILNRQGFVDWRCFGEGTGNETLSRKILEPVTSGDNTTFEYHEVASIADPGAIVACILGGRIPQKDAEPFPNVFLDLVQSGTQTTVTTTLSRGSEKVLSNVYALVSLLGCAVFSAWVFQNVLAVLHKLHHLQQTGQCSLRACTQLADSFVTINFSTVSHGRNLQLSKVILYLNLVTWYIGAADINCTWFVNGVDIWTPGFQLQTSDSPYYQCKPGVFVAHLGSLLGVLRLISISYNFKSLTCQHLILRGATRHSRSLVSPVLLFGLLPTFLVSIVITGINHVRHRLRVLEVLHNQLFIVVLWVAFLFAYHRLLQHDTIGRLYVDVLSKLRVCGRQKVATGSVAATLIGPYYLTLPERVRAEETEWIPLSVAMESALFQLENLDFATRRYAFTGPVVDKTTTKDKKLVEIPAWVLEDDEFFFC